MHRVSRVAQVFWIVLRPGLTILAMLLLAFFLPSDNRGGINLSARAFAAGFAAPVLTSISIDYPEEGSIFPPGITPPTFLWRDAAGDIMEHRHFVCRQFCADPCDVKGRADAVRAD